MATQEFLDEINRRRTFAIISHPDAGKTTITEKLLLYGRAIQKAGTVKGRGSSGTFAKSDWMEMEKERGISVTTSVMQFPYNGCLRGGKNPQAYGGNPAPGHPDPYLHEQAGPGNPGSSGAHG